MIRIMTNLSNVVFILVISRMFGFHLIDLLIQCILQVGISILSCIDILITAWIGCNTDHRTCPLNGCTAASQRYRYDQKQKRKNANAYEHGSITLYDFFQRNLSFYRHVLSTGNDCCSTETACRFSCSGSPVSIFISFFLEKSVIEMLLLFRFLYGLSTFKSISDTLHTFGRAKFQLLFHCGCTVSSTMSFYIRSPVSELCMTQPLNSCFRFPFCESGTLYTSIIICFFLIRSYNFHTRNRCLCCYILSGCPSRFHTSTFHHLISFIIKG